DEPTNHLDLQATELLENALASIESALILVSHDLQFIERLTTRRLHFPVVSHSFQDRCQKLILMSDQYLTEQP
ncbi:MAG TPA: hypothetical protein DCG57_03095, partial [Candidatus Riflebacteria bacterium]|nr:hypothetical protein [Candidatus Riflebacteria bacterium]